MGTLFPAERDCDKGEDRISELPDDILMNFVSPMAMKEAAKTSILSKRWRYLWAKGTHLDFNHLIVLPEVKYLFFPLAAKKNKYINWVNQVVELHCNPWINTFRVCFGFDSSDAHHIDKWVRFAISKKVKNLELNFMSVNSFYTLTFEVVKPSLDVNDSGIRFLQSLYLIRINVSGDILEYLLAQCRVLERLHVERSHTLLRLKVLGLCRKLKHLTILHCSKLEEVEIEAVNLLYLHYGSHYHWSNVVFKNMPNLVEARFHGTCVSDFAPIFQQNSLHAQISKLSLDMKFCVFFAGSLPTFCNIEQLTIIVTDGLDFELARINQFVKACPKLREFTVEIRYSNDDLFEEAMELQELDSSSDDVETEKTQDWEYFEIMYEMELERTCHPNLKEFQVAGFCGWTQDVDLILFLVLISCNLETIICDCSSHCDDGVTGKVIEQVSKSRAAKLVRLISQYSPKISLAIM